MCVCVWGGGGGGAGGGGVGGWKASAAVGNTLAINAEAHGLTRGRVSK